MIRAVTIDLWQTLLVDPVHTLSISRRLRLENVRRLLARGGYEPSFEALGGTVAEMVHVGDDPEADVGGARGVGMRAIHLSRNGHPSGADLVIRSLFELPEAMARL